MNCCSLLIVAFMWKSNETASREVFSLKRMARLKHGPSTTSKLQMGLFSCRLADLLISLSAGAKVIRRGRHRGPLESAP